ncbi:predicted protein [Plenodomus lingam JN3]|uniref:Predicted protein n=1 Tax=Leptosphaeria maculans (strain JN3 / isolate v23.1.3 / race Av1-4-5-6-7-8) TaxID=985895 RepID=E4ZPA0_LEPMJ|nr:predicted protein [Plenodomus lingam JN3]CBX93125.1 predicted protein [Plenodomus lingam JN3]
MYMQTYSRRTVGQGYALFCHYAAGQMHMAGPSNPLFPSSQDMATGKQRDDCHHQATLTTHLGLRVVARLERQSKTGRAISSHVHQPSWLTRNLPQSACHRRRPSFLYSATPPSRSISHPS